MDDYTNEIFERKLKAILELFRELDNDYDNESLRIDHEKVYRLALKLEVTFSGIADMALESPDRADKWTP
jgi:hypothetical protein